MVGSIAVETVSYHIHQMLCILSNDRRRFDDTAGLFNSFSAFVVSLAFGLVRRWNQTGQKYAGEPDISSRILPYHTWLLWLLVIGTYVLITFRLNTRVMSSERWRPMNVLAVPVSIAAFFFKVAFTAADAPELLRGVNTFYPIVVLSSKVTLVAQARVVFVGNVTLLALAVYFEITEDRKSNRKGTSVLSRSSPNSTWLTKA